jgi:uncharacterized coiled-coil protein SlyX
VRSSLKIILWTLGPVLTIFVPYNLYLFFYSQSLEEIRLELLEELHDAGTDERATITQMQSALDTCYTQMLDCEPKQDVPVCLTANDHQKAQIDWCQQKMKEMQREIDNDEIQLDSLTDRYNALWDNFANMQNVKCCACPDETPSTP